MADRPDNASVARDFVAAATALAEAVHFDDGGRMVGLVRQGGNGGLLSRETIQAADRVKTLAALFDVGERQ